MAKRPGSLILTFSKKNTDIRTILENKKLEDETFIVTDYICEAIRFYEKHKDNAEFSNLDTVKKLIDERLNAFIMTKVPISAAVTEPEQPVPAAPVQEIINELEMNLDDISIDED